MDFYQLGPTTLHDLQPERRGHARSLVVKHAKDRPATLVMPMLYQEMERPALLGIRQGLEKADFLHEIIVPLTARDEEEVATVRRFFRDLPVPVTIAWCEGPEIQEGLQRLSEKGFDLRGFGGKGLAVWLGLGIASETAEAIVMHDADIERYDPKILHRLLLPILAPEMDFYFAKGYYARLTNEQMFGRITRLFFWPLLDALATSIPQHSAYLRYLRSFRYPLSGDVAMRSDLARNLRVPTDWGFEVGVLGEVYRNASPKRICQVDLGTYNHKHNTLGANKTEGLQRMALDIATSVLRQLAALEGARITPDLLTTLRVTYRREAQDAIRKYHMDSIANGLRYDRHDEEVLAETLEPLLREAGNQFMMEPTKDLIGEWLRAISADPEAPRRMRGTRTLTIHDAQSLAEDAVSDALR